LFYENNKRITLDQCKNLAINAGFDTFAIQNKGTVCWGGNEVNFFVYGYVWSCPELAGEMQL